MASNPSEVTIPLYLAFMRLLPGVQCAVLDPQRKEKGEESAEQKEQGQQLQVTARKILTRTEKKENMFYSDSS